jgi:hypothetical protein
MRCASSRVVRLVWNGSLGRPFAVFGTTSVYIYLM